MTDENLILQGTKQVPFLRFLDEASTKKATMCSYVTGNNFNLSRQVTNTATKQGQMPTPGTLTTAVTLNVLNAATELNDNLYKAILKTAKAEYWQVSLDRKKDGKYFAWYVRGYVTAVNETSNANADSTLAVTFTPEGEPQRGWLDLDGDTLDEINYVFRGIGVVSDNDPNGAGTAFDDDKDAGQGNNDPEPAPQPSSPSKADGQGTTPTSQNNKKNG